MTKDSVTNIRNKLTKLYKKALEKEGKSGGARVRGGTSMPEILAGVLATLLSPTSEAIVPSRKLLANAPGDMK